MSLYRKLKHAYILVIRCFRDVLTEFWRLARYSNLSDAFLPRVYVFLCSTFSDLQLERKAIRLEALKEYNLTMMEVEGLLDKLAERSWRGTAPGDRNDEEEYAIKWSKNGIERSHIIVVLLGDSYGSVPNTEFVGYSYTRLELTWALEKHKKLLVYKLHRPFLDLEVLENARSYKETLSTEKKPLGNTFVKSLQANTSAQSVEKLEEQLKYIQVKDIFSAEELIQSIRQDVKSASFKVILARALLYVLLCAIISAWAVVFISMITVNH